MKFFNLHSATIFGFLFFTTSLLNSFHSLCQNNFEPKLKEVATQISWKSTVSEVIEIEKQFYDLERIDTIGKNIYVYFKTFYIDGYYEISIFSFSKNGKLFIKERKIFNNLVNEESKEKSLKAYEYFHQEFSEEWDRPLPEFQRGEFKYFSFTLYKILTSVTVLKDFENPEKYYLSIQEQKL